jgi:hypothetical protein
VVISHRGEVRKESIGNNEAKEANGKQNRLASDMHGERNLKSPDWAAQVLFLD